MSRNIPPGVSRFDSLEMAQTPEYKRVTRTMTADDELDARWIPGDAVNNATALLRYYERKRDETPWYAFWDRWTWHGCVAAAERERDRVYKQHGVVTYEPAAHR